MSAVQLNNSQPDIHTPYRAGEPAADVASNRSIAFDELLVEVARRSDEFSRLLHVPRDVIAKMKRAGIFRAGTPKRFGGDALAPADFLRMLERIAIADGSAAWVAAFGSANTYLTALPLETQRLIYSSGPDQVFAGGLYPVQPAVAADGGWRISGRWQFASGCKGADWIGVGISGVNGGRPNDPGMPLVAVFPAQEVEIVDNWDVVGMQGTGSHDLRLENKFVAHDWTFVRGGSPLIDEPLYRYPAVSFQAEVHAVINLGLARAALDRITAMAGGTKTVTGAPRLADRNYFRIELAKAEAAQRSARAFFFETSEAAFEAIVAGDPLSVEQANLLRLSATHAAHVGADVVQRAYRLGGMAAIQASHPLQRMLRDAMVVTQHGTLGESTYDGAGAVFTGVAPVIVPYP